MFASDDNSFHRIFHRLSLDKELERALIFVRTYRVDKPLVAFRSARVFKPTVIINGRPVCFYVSATLIIPSMAEIVGGVVVLAAPRPGLEEILVGDHLSLVHRKAKAELFEGTS